MLLRGFERAFSKACTRETSSDPEGWTEGNPFWGHCAVVALVAQEIFGGEILRASLEGTEFSHMRSHYWNRLPDGSEFDLSQSQFGNNRPVLVGSPRDPSEILSYPETAKRYALLYARFLGR
jgi:hypothetical protein